MVVISHSDVRKQSCLTPFGFQQNLATTFENILETDGTGLQFYYISTLKQMEVTIVPELQRYTTLMPTQFMRMKHICP